MEDVKEHFKKLGCMFVSGKEEYFKLIPTCKQFSKEDIFLIYKALYKAEQLHLGMQRKNGEPYLNHPIAVSSLLARYGFDGETVAAALLHDTIEDTSYTIEDCKKDFDDTVAMLVDGVTKIGCDVNKATHKKIVESTNKDVRSYGIKGADRLHNMYTLEYLPINKQIEIATETKDFYVPSSKILGIYQLKDALQDLCLFYLDNDSFLKYKYKRDKLKDKYEKTCNELGCNVQEKLSKLGISMRYNYRIKNIGGIYEDVSKGININEIEDLLAIKMVLLDPLLCYQALGVIHSLGLPRKGSIEDYIALPKENGYKSLNTNVVYKDSDVQVRIRTEDMQKTNDLGVFSHLDLDTELRVNTDMKKV